jgi:hypothetical protein
MQRREGRMLLASWVLAVACTCAAADPAATPVAWGSFETVADMTRLRPLNPQATVAQPTDHATAGKHALCVRWRGAARGSFDVIYPAISLAALREYAAIVFDRAAAGLKGQGTPRVAAVGGRSYENHPLTPAVSATAESLVVGNLHLPGVAADFDPHRAASFAVVDILVP